MGFSFGRDSSAPPFSRFLPDLELVEDDNWMAAIHDRPDETMEMTLGLCVVNCLLESACDLHIVITPSKHSKFASEDADVLAWFPAHVQ